MAADQTCTSAYEDEENVNFSDGNHSKVNEQADQDGNNTVNGRSIVHEENVIMPTGTNGPSTVTEAIRDITNKVVDNVRALFGGTKNDDANTATKPELTEEERERAREGNRIGWAIAMGTAMDSPCFIPPYDMPTKARATTKKPDDLSTGAKTTEARYADAKPSTPDTNKDDAAPKSAVLSELTSCAVTAALTAHVFSKTADAAAKAVEKLDDIVTNADEENTKAAAAGTTAGITKHKEKKD